MKNAQEVTALINEGKSQIIEDMKERGYGAILWNNSTAGFHFIPEIVVTDTDRSRTMRIMGLYHCDGVLYAIEEGKAPVHLTDFYTEGVEVPPVVVTLTEDMARTELGIPSESRGYTTQGTPEEWLAIADCYFEALNEK